MTAQRETEVRGPTSPGTERAYDQTCATYRAIDDFRAKLLGFLPIATGGGATALIYPAVLAGWAFVAIQPGSQVGAAVSSLVVFIVGFVLIVRWDSALRKEAAGWRNDIGPSMPAIQEFTPRSG